MTVHNPLSFQCISIKAVMDWLKTSESIYPKSADENERVHVRRQRKIPSAAWAS